MKYIQKIIVNEDGELWRSLLHAAKIGDRVTINHPKKLDQDGNYYEFILIDGDIINVLRYGKLHTPIERKL